MWRRSRTKRRPASITHREVEEGTGRPGYPSYFWASEDRRDELSMTREVVRDEFSEKQRDGLMITFEVREDGFDQKPKRETCKRQKKTDEMTCARRSNKFDFLKLTERGQEVEEVNAVDVLQAWRSLSIRQVPKAYDRSK